MTSTRILCVALLLVWPSPPTSTVPPSVTLGPAQKPLERYQFEHAAMGVTFRYLLYCEEKGTAERLFAAARQRVEALNQSLSDYLEESETNQLCRTAPHHEPRRVSADLYRLVSRGLEFSHLTGGAFDVTVGPASHAWRKAIKRNRLPEAAKIAELRPAIGADKVELRPPDQLRLIAPDMQLDFGGIAQGDAADEVAAIFLAAGIKSALIDASGDIRAIGSPPGEAGWSIEITQPSAAESAIVCLKDAAISTSGDLEQRLVIDGIRYSHLVDPRTARAVEQSVQATVIGPDATTADALASALCVLSPDEGLKLIESLPGVEAQLILPDKSGTQPQTQTSLIKRSRGFEKYLKANESKK
jgi:thiamine biosynthesis lipoprotein